ncbi:hypothetical protein PEM37_34040 [Streptomyces sp. AD681]|uniref:hypothetical protein n=1 Tax=Streptomyces sp. AD681 TaxID=3019069 RepID=UPI0022F1D4DE|nr:hypothetical protein [Streptomyces sp. AD681]MDA5146544.1 hypothetical protein [Streptomyces sp. AD681]
MTLVDIGGKLRGAGRYRQTSKQGIVAGAGLCDIYGICDICARSVAAPPSGLPNTGGTPG